MVAARAILMSPAQTLLAHEHAATVLMDTLVSRNSQPRCLSFSLCFVSAQALVIQLALTSTSAPRHPTVFRLICQIFVHLLFVCSRRWLLAACGVREHTRRLLLPRLPCWLHWQLAVPMRWYNACYFHRFCS